MGHDVVYHDPTTSMHPMSLSLWRGMESTRNETMKSNLDVLLNITEGQTQPLMFGSQPSALEFMDNETMEQAVDLLVQIYTDAQLYDPEEETPDELVACAIGSYDL